MEGEIVQVSLIVLIAILFIRALSKMQEPPKTNSFTNQPSSKSDDWWDNFFLYFLLLDLFSFKESEAATHQESDNLQTNYLEWFNQQGTNAQYFDNIVERHNEEMEELLDRNEWESEDIDYDYEDSFEEDLGDSI